MKNPLIVISMLLLVAATDAVAFGQARIASSNSYAGRLGSPPVGFVSLMTPGNRYRHKSETEIAGLTPAQRVDEFAAEQAHHKYDVLDDHGHLIEKYIWLDGLKALPRIIEVMDDYNPNQKRGPGADRFDAMWMLLGNLDNHVVRLRGSAEGQHAIDSLARAVNRMRAAGYEIKEPHEWKWVPDGRFELAAGEVERVKGLNYVDWTIRDTLRLERKVVLSEKELLVFSNFLVSRDPSYPSWSGTNYFRDYTQINSAGNPLWVYTMKKPEPFYEAYLEFKKAMG